MERLIERIDFSGAEFVESDGHKIVKNVVMLGPVSSHGYEYTQEAMRRAVEGGLYEGCRIFINHKEGARDLMHLAGVFKNTRHEGSKVRGDAHLLDDDYGRKFWNIAKTMPEAAGCSHVADGRLVKDADGKQKVEEITKVYSVDLVVQGATTKNVFEGQTLSESLPKPGPKERQIDFVPRCMGLVQAGNSSISNDEAFAMCSTAWGARFEPGGQTDEDPLPVAPQPTAKQESTTGPTAQKESIHMSTTDKLTEEFASRDRMMAEGMSILSLSPSAEAIASRHATEDRDAAYEQHQRQRQQDARDRLRIESEIRAEGIFSRGYSNPEPFEEVQKRLDAKERIKREAEHEGEFSLHLD